ncbi:hypothetical protein CCACVL1_11283 [Corchorus capsularis]|uniref:Mitochondrial inner membrane translocase subunit Tim17/Tim22/Tim23/peroxisomal protein PMP24 n=1 Tax=Corchorus capsularis TaxID=210143 RepID=A0A1R3IM68_COCAP|nr:hypothetical protein CCACVL1_11283 [Corchorus capsularis]
MASLDSSNSSSPENDPETNPSPNPSSTRAIMPNPSYPCLAAECLYNFVGGSVFGALGAYPVGYVYGLIEGKGFNGSFMEAGSFAKEYAVWLGIDSLVVCFLRRLTGKDDVITHGIAGCCAGLALCFPGAPQELMRSCLTYGAINFASKALLEQKPALAHSFSTRNKSPQPMALPLTPSSGGV